MLENMLKKFFHSKNTKTIEFGVTSLQQSHSKIFEKKFDLKKFSDVSSK